MNGQAADQGGGRRLSGPARRSFGMILASVMAGALKAMNGQAADQSGGGRRPIDVDRFVHALAGPRQDVHQLIVDTIAGAAAARQAVLVVCDDAGRTLTVTATRGSPASLLTGSVIAPGAGVIGRTFATRRPQLLSGASALAELRSPFPVEPRSPFPADLRPRSPVESGSPFPAQPRFPFPAEPRSSPADPEPPSSADPGPPSPVESGPPSADHWLPFPAGSCISVPLVARGKAQGVITLIDRVGGRPFNQADLSAVQALASPAALALACERVEQARSRLEQAVALDPLTGLLNRGGIDARLRQELDRARRHHESVALVAIDVDRFKSLNDALGHPGGDAVLKGLAVVFRRSVRTFDLCARFGGDEFAIVMPRAAAADACRSAERIRRRMEDYWPDAVSPRPAGLRITASFGVAVSRPDSTPPALVESADRALYAAKSNGRNRVHLESAA